MLQFEVYRDGAAAKDIDLSGAYAFGQDSIPIRAELTAEEGRITCVKRVPGAVGLALPWDAGVSGRVLLPTTRLPERNRPYILNVELARAQMMRILQKREDWGLFDYPGAETLNKSFDSLREKFIGALKAGDPAKASVLADAALGEGATLGEKIALMHADILLGRRKAAGNPRGMGFGCLAGMAASSESYLERMRDAFDFVSLPTRWKHIEPKEGQFQFAPVDAWVAWAAKNRKFIHAGPLLSFEPAHVPEWLYVWEHDYETLRDLVYEHIQRVVKRYDKQVRLWNVVSGIHAHNSFNLNFEQLMELTRMSCLLVKKLAPQSQVMIELVLPWGEYYARNQRTIPPMLYADMAAQSGVKFDAYGVQVQMGVPVDGHYVRDLMQVSSLLDEFVTLGKPVHITAFEAPSDVSVDPDDAWGGQAPVARGGQWHAPWSPRLQAEWLQAFCRIALSKPYVESVCWRDLADVDGHYIPHGGLCGEDMEPKTAYRELRAFRSSLMPQAPAGGNSDPHASAGDET